MKKTLSLAILALLMLTLVAMGCPPKVLDVELPQGPYPAPPKEWSRTFGGPDRDWAYSVQQTADGGFIIAGSTMPHVTRSRFQSYFWLVKTDPEGNKEWSQAFGGPESQVAYSVQQTDCGGFIVAGTTYSFGEGRGDFWLIKTDSEGNKQWSRTFGGAELDWGWSVQQTVDGGFIITGKTESFGEGKSDFWLIKTDPQGNKEWSRTFGGPESDNAYSVQQTRCGGFIIAGWTESFGEGESDFWLVKTDPQGNREWSQTFGGAKEDRAASVQQTACGGFIMAGTTYSFGVIEKTKPLPFGEGWSDFWLIKTDPQGNKEWSRTFGGHEPDRAWSVWQTTDGGFILAGATGTALPRPFLMPGLPLGTRLTCIWVIKTDPYGNIQWAQTFGRLGESDMARSVQQTACGGFIIAGTTDSFCPARGDFWLIKLASSK